MGEDERQAGTPVGGARAAGAAPDEGPRDPEEIKRDIEETRRELGDTVAAITEKADVKAKAKAKVDEVKSSVGGKKEKFSERAKQAAPESGGQAAEQAKVVAREHRTGVMIAGAAVVGFVIGRITAR